MTRSTWSRVVARLFDKKKTQTGEQGRRRRLSLEWLEARLAPATDIWTGLGGADNHWSDAANWNRAGVAQVPQAGDDLIFDGRTSNRTTNNDLAAGFSINSITISASNYTLGGSSAATLGDRIMLGANGIHVGQGFTNEKAALDIQLGSVTLTTPTAFNFTVDDGADLTVSGHLSGYAVTTLAKNGTGIGTLILTNDNTAVNPVLNGGMNGAIDIRTGILSITNSKALGSTIGSTTVQANAQLQLGVGGLSVGEFLNLNGRGARSDGALLNAVGNSAWTGTVSMDSDSTIGANSTTDPVTGVVTPTVLTISGLVTDTGTGHNLTKEGSGQVIFARVGGNTYRGQTIVNNGVLTIEDPLSLGAGADSTKPQSGTPLSGTIVNSNSGSGNAGTLQLQFASLNPGDPNGILQNPALPFNAVSNLYVGFQVFNDLITLNGSGFNGLGALSNAAGNNGWDGNVILGSGPPNSGAASIGAAAGSQLTVSGVVQDGTQRGSLTKLLPGRVILDDNNTYTGSTVVAAGALQIRDSHALGNNPGDPTPGGSVSVFIGAALELGVDSGLDGTAARTHNRNLGFDSATMTGPGQEVYVTPVGTSTTGTFQITFKGQTTTALAYNATALQVQNALNLLSTINVGGGSVTVTAAGGLYRIIFNGPLAGTNQPLLSVTTNAGATAVVNPIYGLKVSKVLSISGDGIASTGALRSVTGINTYVGAITLNSNIAGIGVDTDTRAGHPLADSTYFTNDYSLTVASNIGGGQGTTLAKDSTGQLILARANSYLGATNVVAGWITVQDSGALGGTVTGLADTIQPLVTVQAGAAIHLKALSSGTGLTISKNFILSGLGISHPYSMINQEGALLNLGGVNTLSGDIALTKNVGLGAQNLDPTPTLNNSQSQLTFTGSISDFVAPSRTVFSSDSDVFFDMFQRANIIDTGFTNGGTISLTWDFRTIADHVQIYSAPIGTAGSTLLYDSGLVAGPNTILVSYPAGSSKLEVIVNQGNFSFAYDRWSYKVIIQPNSPGFAGGITKLGNSRVILQGDGTYTGGVDVKEGILRVQNDSALGHNTSGTSSGTESFSTTTTTVEAGAQLEVGNTIPSNNGGLQAGSQIQDENLVLNGQAQTLNISGIGGTYTLTYNNGTYSATTVALAYNAPANGGMLATDSIQNALNAILSPIGGSVTVTKSGNVYTVVFGGSLVAANNPTLIATTPATDSSLAIAVTNLATSLGAISGDNRWRGAVTMSANTTFDVAANSRLTIDGPIDDATNLSPGGSSLTKTGTGELVLQGANTYNGTTFINQGILTAANSQALGNAGTTQAVQNVTITGAFPFTLTFNGQTTTVLNSASATSPRTCRRPSTT
jgi:fibronectin-binding autotransporter adhesin